MLTLSESEGRRNNTAADRKRQKGKKRTKLEKGQKQGDNDPTEEKNQLRAEELQIHELMPVPYKSEDNEHNMNTTEVTFAQEQDCQSVACISGMDNVSNSNKFVIITLLEPEPQTMTGEELLNAEGNDKIKAPEMQKKVLLLHKIDSEGAATIEQAPVVPKEEGEKDFDNQLMTINFSDIATTGDQKDLGIWVKVFPSLVLCFTESGKPYVKCPACTAMYFKATSFEKHVSCHIKKVDDRYICNFCKYDVNDANMMFDHLTIHQDQCEICNMNLTRKNSFKKHWEFSEMQMTFTVKRDRWGRFICIYCKLGFDLCHQLQKHWFKHSCNSQRTSQCNSCSGLFDNDEALQNHVCLKCPVCGKVLDSVHRLRSHCRYEKHYVYCQVCTYEFILSVDLDKHMALHKKAYVRHKEYPHCLESEDGTTFQCELCGKIYFSMSGLVLHLHDDHKMAEAEDDDLARISLPDVKDGTTSYDIITTLKGDTDFQEVLVAPAEKLNNAVDAEGNEQCEPVALCWNRYSLDDQSTVRKTT